MSERSAVVVGAGTGTGAEVARVFAEAGYAVAVSRRNAAALAPLVDDITAAGGKSIAVAADAGEESEVTALFEAAERELGPVEVAVFNAASMIRSPIAETGVEDFERVWRATSLGGFLVGREAARRMSPRGRGTILMTGATASVKASANFGAFAAGKHGLRAVSMSLAKEVGPVGIHVAHVVVDGLIDVPRVHEMMPEVAAALGREGLLDPRHIADAYLGLHRQPRDAWTFELDLRPFRENW